MTSILDTAAATNINSVAVCALGSGIFGWNDKLAREVLVRATVHWEQARARCTALTVVFYDRTSEGAELFRAALHGASADRALAAAPPFDPSRRAC